MAKSGNGGLFGNPAKKLKGLIKFFFWVFTLCFVAYGIYLLVDGLAHGADIANLAVEAAISIIGMPIVLYLAALAGTCLLDMIAAVREIADKMNSGKDD